MCLNPLEISYSHIAEITLQDAHNVISQGFSTSICCQGETLTSNIMDFCLFPPLSSSLMLFPSQSLFCPVLEISFLLSFLWTQALFQVYVINLAKQFYRRDHSHTEGYGEHVTFLLLINPGGKLASFSSALLHFNVKVFLSLDFPCSTYFTKRRESR